MCLHWFLIELLPVNNETQVNGMTIRQHQGDVECVACVDEMDKRVDVVVLRPH